MTSYSDEQLRDTSQPVRDTSQPACVQGTGLRRPPIGPDAPWLAPLAGWSDLAFRFLCRENGAAVCCTEMISAKGLWFERRGGSRATRELLATAPDDTPVVAQLFGEDPHYMADAVRMLADVGWQYVDCNMGCAVPKVTRTGAGAALLREPERAMAVAEAMLAAGHERGIGLGFKLRLGWDTTDRSGLVLLERLAAAGADWLTLHPRTARQGFSGTADRTALCEAATSLHGTGVALLASGDLWSAQDGLACLRESGVDGIMYARGALRDPAICARYRALYEAELRQNVLQASTHELRPVIEPSVELEAASALYARMLRHAELARRYASPHTALLKMRTAIPRYVRHLSGAKALRVAVIGCRSWEDFFAALEQFFSNLPTAFAASAHNSERFDAACAGDSEASDKMSHGILSQKEEAWK